MEANKNDFPAYDEAWSLMNKLAVESTLVFLTYNIAFHKKAIHETIKMKMEEENMKGKERTPEQLIAATLEVVAGASSCKNCEEPDNEIKDLYQTALDNYARNIGGSDDYLS